MSRTESEYRHTVEINPDFAQSVQIVVTGEGIILDAFDNGTEAGTFAKTFDELYEWLTGTSSEPVGRSMSTSTSTTVS